MKATRTTKLKIGPAPHLDALVVRYLRAACWVSKQVFNSGELNTNRLSRAFYAVVREKFDIPSQLTCSLFRQVAGNYKTMQESGLWRLAVYSRPTMPVTYKHDFARNRKGVIILGETVSLTHHSIPIHGWGDSKVKRVGDCWYLCLAHEVDIPEPLATGGIVGVDMGIKRLLVATNSANEKTFFYKGGVLNHRRTCIRRTRGAVQSVGSKSSRRLLRRMSGHEEAVTVVLLHTASKRLVRYAVAHGARRIVVEELGRDLRAASKKKGKRLCAKVHRWPFAKARFFLTYKAAAVGIEVEAVDPRNTSRGCNTCGHVSKSNRRGLRFCCQKCGHTDDADRNASKNIRLRSVFTELRSVETGSVNAPKSIESVDLSSKSCVLHGDSVLVEDSAKSPCLEAGEL